MQKCFAVAELVFDETTGSIIKTGTVYDRDRLPVGVTERNGKADRFLLNEWWRDRSIPDTRQGIKDALYALEINNTQVLPLRSYGLSLSDSYWILPESSNINWYDLNFFENAFSEDVGDVLFGQESNIGTFNFNSPDNTTDGYLKKRWKIANGKRCLIKGGSNPFRQQPFNEVIASKIMDRLGIDHVPYTIIWEDGEPYSVCEDFVTRDTELVSAWRIMQTQKKDNSTSVYQHFVREDRRVALFMAGLPGSVSALLSDKSASFLRRAAHHRLGRIDDHDVRDAFRETIEDAGKTIEAAALDEVVAATDGFAYMMQLVGYRAWMAAGERSEVSLADARNGARLAHDDFISGVIRKTCQELSDGDLAFLEAMLPDGGEASSMSDIARRMGKTPSYARVYRARLLEQGVIAQERRGYVRFDMPLLREFLMEE